MDVIKRDGRIVKYNGEKIVSAITKAMLSFQEIIKPEDLELANRIAKEIGNTRKKRIEVEEIQNLIEKKLMNSNRKDVAKAFIIYRNDRTRIRESNSYLNKEIAEKIGAKTVENSNANLDERSFGGRLGTVNSVVMKEYALNNCMSEMARNNHLHNMVYQHDLDQYAIGNHNCADGSMWIKIKKDGLPRTVTIEDFGKELGISKNQLIDVSKDNYEILSRDGWTKLHNLTCRELGEDENLYTIKTRSGLPLKITGEHRLPILRNGEEILCKAKDIKIGDSLMDIESIQLSSEEIAESFLDLSSFNNSKLDLRIVNLSPLKSYLRFKYGVVYTTYAKNNNFRFKGDTIYLDINDFKQLSQKYPLSFDLLTQLRIKSCGSKHDYPLFIPYTKELAKVYAYIYADGGVYVNERRSLFQLTFTNTNEKIMDDFIDCYESCFGYRLNKIFAKNWHTSPCIRVTDGSRLIVSLFKDFAGAKKYSAAEISLPNFVINGNDEIKYAYLSACIDSDGCLSTDIAYTSCCKKYCEQLKIMLQYLGYHPTITLSDKKGSIYKFGSKIGRRNFDTFTLAIRRNDEKYILQKHISTIKYNDSYSYKGLNNKFNENKIVNIIITQPKTLVYDLETKSHWYILNNYVSHNCLSIPFDDLLANGFTVRQTDIRPAQSINTAFQLLAVIFQVQSLQQFGGVSATHLDWTMVPYVRKSFWKYIRDGFNFLDKVWDIPENSEEISIVNSELSESIKQDFKKVYDYAMKHTEKELAQATEAMYHNLNSLQSRSGNQLPFTSINYGTCTLEEGRMVIKAVLNASIKGLGKFYRTSIFPCGIFKLKKGINREKNDPNYDLFQLALKSTAKRLYPNYANVDWSGNAGYDPNDPRTEFSTMGKCKLQLI